MCPPPAAITASHLLMLFISLFTSYTGIRLHSWCNALSKSASELTSWLPWTRRPSISHMCSIGDKSGDRAGQSSTLTLFLCNKSIVYLAVWQRALSCCRVALWRRIKGSMWGVTICWQYRTAVKVPATVTKSVRAFLEIPPHTIILPPPNRSRWTTLGASNRYPSRRHTRTRPSENCSVNLDSCVNKMLFHCCLLHRWWAAAQLYRLRRCTAVRGTPT